MKTTNSATDYKWRYWVVIVLLLAVAIGLLWRMIDLTIFDRGFLQHQGNARTLRIVSIPAYRGMIVDRNGEPLAVSTPVEAVWINPKEFHPNDKELTRLANLLGISASQLRSRLDKSAHREFMYLRRQVDPDLSLKVQQLNLSGLYFRKEYRRYYPEGEVSAQIVGITDIDDQGQEGLELAYNSWLHGVEGSRRVVKDRYGHIVAEINTIKKPTPGHNLVLSLDRRIQYLTYVALKEGVQENKAASGSAVVIDVSTGEVLAIASVPSFNPNNRDQKDVSSHRNRALTDTFEPGSTMKTLAMANALASGLYKPTTLIDTTPGWYVVNGKVVRDEHNNGVIDLTTILQRSSNVGMSKITLSLPPKTLPTLLNLVGFGKRVTEDFPGESVGSVPNGNQLNQFGLATLSFGYGIAVTNVQLANAYTILARDGVKIPISLLRVNQVPHGQRILTAKVAKQVDTLLQSVVTSGGTSVRAQVPGYLVAGKSGTARIVGANGYEQNHHNSIFVGMAPASKPRLVIAVIINDPEGKLYFGGDVAAPVFANVMGSALRLLDVSPDNLVTTASPTSQSGGSITNSPRGVFLPGIQKAPVQQFF